MKPGFLAALLFLAFLRTPCACHAEIDKGLSFRSYEVPPVQRTSLSIPAEEHSALRFGAYFAVSFDLKIDTGKECFGYVCRIVLDNACPVDLILSNPVGGVPYLGVNTPSGGFEPLELEPGSGLDDWNRVEIAIADARDTLSVSANGKKVAAFGSRQQKHTAVVLFGRNSHGTFTTSDVAPMAIRNLALSLRKAGQSDYRWELGSGDDLSQTGPAGPVAVGIRNPEWLAERHSRWRKIQEFAFGSKVFPVIDSAGARILFVSADKVTLFRPREKKVEEYPFAQHVDIDLITNDFIVLPDGRLIYYDFEDDRPVVNEFDFGTSRWQRPIGRSTHSKYLHHNKFFNPVDSSVVQLFGYGFHRYLNEAVRWPVGSDSASRFPLDAIPPRYLGAVGLTDTAAYIYGGKGNDRGIQEFGTKFYNDLYRLDLRNYTVSKLWEAPEPDSHVAASNLIIDSTGFTALFYSPDSQRSHLRMRTYSIADGSCRPAGDSIPYDFIDIASDAGLMFDPESETYYAVVASKTSGNGYQASVYAIRSPVIAPAEPGVRAARRFRYYSIPIGLFAAIGIAVALLRRRKRRDRDAPLPETPTVEPTSRRGPGIYLLGGFRVVDAAGREITANFTPIMRQLLVLIILYTDKQSGRGISGAELKEALWSDKSEKSYYNNRGVNIRKIRMWLSKVGAVEIASADGYWHLAGDVSLCDYIRHNRYLARIDSGSVSDDELQTLIDMARCGTLLPDMQFEWTDRFKADYTDRFILLLSRIRDNGPSVFSPQTAIRLADAILSFDSLDEDALRVKCRALIRLKRHGIAKNIFNAFIQEYKRLMGEDYGQSFDRFIQETDTEP